MLFLSFVCFGCNILGQIGGRLSSLKNWVESQKENTSLNSEKTCRQARKKSEFELENVKNTEIDQSRIQDPAQDKKDTIGWKG